MVSADSTLELEPMIDSGWLCTFKGDKGDEVKYMTGRTLCSYKQFIYGTKLESSGNICCKGSGQRETGRNNEHICKLCFTLVLILLVLLSHKCALFPVLDVWDGDKGRLLSLSVQFGGVNFYLIDLSLPKLTHCRLFGYI